jgi:hypothetical protein
MYFMLTRLRINATHAYAERGLDPYWTPPEATRALLAIEVIPNQVWEPACGAGAIAKVLVATGRKVWATDIIKYPGFALDTEINFLALPPKYETWHVESIITNPPFKLAQQFAKQALLRAPYVAFLLRLNFLESMERLAFFRAHPPARVWISSRRLPMMHRFNWAGKKAPSNHCFAWFVWQGAPRAPEIRWFDWKHVEKETPSCP